MVKLQKSQALQRIIRQDDPPELMTSTWSLVRKALQEKKLDEAMALIDYGCAESIAIHDSLVAFVNEALTSIAHLDEAKLEDVLRAKYYTTIKNWLATTPGIKETMERCAEFQRSHFSTLSVKEEPDRYVVKCDPCGSGGRLRRTRTVETTKKAYPWSWGKSGIPYYCTHCALMWEIIPIELRGYPLRITLIAERAEDPCTHLFYKKPELIPDEYYTRVGKTPFKAKPKLEK